MPTQTPRQNSGRHAPDPKTRAPASGPRSARSWPCRDWCSRPWLGGNRTGIGTVTTILRQASCAGCRTVAGDPAERRGCNLAGRTGYSAAGHARERYARPTERAAVSHESAPPSRSPRIGAGDWRPMPALRPARVLRRGLAPQRATARIGLPCPFRQHGGQGSVVHPISTSPTHRALRFRRPHRGKQIVPCLLQVSTGLITGLR